MRELLAALGARSLDVSAYRPAATGHRHAARRCAHRPVRLLRRAPRSRPRTGSPALQATPGGLAATLDARLSRPSNEGGDEFEIRNTDRSIGTRLSGLIARHHGNTGMDDRPLTLRLRGSAGQSFGAFNAGGLRLHLEGEANDYVGKGMAGGRIVLQPPAGSTFASQDAPILGNTCLYGATGGELRRRTRRASFAVRNLARLR